ncbi:glyoxylase-like metal-dependent hydrolase (beta-lactamase superfamily II) [Marinobacter pelagius]|uniref:Glyoxylase-like metal-dependent hydrolase (Beta-lactamase superfamily II) n=1 Tax=Marinobacter pelagius TaxID=379482 RepID=A0A366GLL3_9GAMM|nr:MBL fold metallo-hydrolase [Marinobacter pelagius]RBP27077.1 glyoxylase-like metal-dependent hydrolase (beta-lactamase superfamily II) [Marinobacter pelagius]
MIFRQLFDDASSTFTYLLADENEKEAILIDAVFSQAKRDLALLDELGLTLVLAADTHAHADHITAAWLLNQKTGCRIASAKAIGAEHVDVPLEDGQEFGVAGVTLRAISTPGHTDGCMSYVMADQSMVFTGDAILIRGCGRSDFQQGSAHKLFESITSKLFALPVSCLVYPAHDYHGRSVSTIGEEKAFNARVGGGANETDFVEYMNAMKLPHPKKIDEALPANLRSGCPEDGKLPEEPDWADIRLTYAGVPETGEEWLEHHLDEVTVLDVRLAEEVKDCPVTEALVDLHIPLDQLRSRVGDVPREKPVVALCRSGRRSAMAVNILRENGFEKVASLSRGLMEITRN